MRRQTKRDSFCIHPTLEQEALHRRVCGGAHINSVRTAFLRTHINIHKSLEIHRREISDADSENYSARRNQSSHRVFTAWGDEGELVMQQSRDTIYDTSERTLLRWTPPPVRSVHRRANFEYRLASKPVGGTSKRFVDLAISATALVVLAPLLIVVAGAIRLNSPGPALFRQRRTGFRGRAFSIYKFRSMQHQQPIRGRLDQAVLGDKRVTSVGRFLRRSSIDELPQLLNVFLGDMSLVGPRPHAVEHDHAFSKSCSGYPRRFLARPGITGLAQVSGSRGESETAEKIATRTRLDLQYVDNWSIVRDLSILTSTVGVVFHDPNAY